MATQTDTRECPASRHDGPGKHCEHRVSKPAPAGDPFIVRLVDRCCGAERPVGLVGYGARECGPNGPVGPMFLVKVVGGKVVSYQ